MEHTNLNRNLEKKKKERKTFLHLPGGHCQRFQRCAVARIILWAAPSLWLTRGSRSSSTNASSTGSNNQSEKQHLWSNCNFDKKGGSASLCFLHSFTPWTESAHITVWCILLKMVRTQVTMPFLLVVLLVGTVHGYSWSETCGSCTNTTSGPCMDPDTSDCKCVYTSGYSRIDVV